MPSFQARISIITDSIDDIDGQLNPASSFVVVFSRRLFNPARQSHSFMSAISSNGTR